MPWLWRTQLTVTWLDLTMPKQTAKNNLKVKKVELPQMNFVLEKKLIKFSCTYQPLSLCKIFIKEIFELIQSYEDVCHFGTKTAHLSWTIFFWYKPLLLLSSTYGLFHRVKFKRNLTIDPELWRYTIFGPKVVHLAQKKFFRKPVNEPCFFDSWVSTCQKLKSDINLLVKYWWFKNT